MGSFFAVVVYLLSATPGAVPSPLPGTDAIAPASVRLDLHVDLAHRTVDGQADWTFDATPEPPTLLLYPNRFDAAPPWLNDLTLGWTFPGVPEAGSLQIDAAWWNGRPVARPTGRVEHWPLPAPAPPLADAAPQSRLTLRFTTHVPQRYGPFGVVDGGLTVDGGLYPVLAGGTPGEPRPHAIDVTVRGLPPGALVVLNGRVRRVAGDAAPVHVALPAASALALRILPPGARVTQHTAGPTRLAFVHRARRGSPADNDTPGAAHTAAPELALIPAEREVLQTAAAGLAFLGETLPELRPPRALLLVEAPLRRDLALPVSQGVFVSDFAFRVTPVERILKFHRFRLLRALFAQRFRELLAAREAPADAAWVADVLAEWALRQFVRTRYGAEEDAFGVLAPGAFLAVIDDVLQAPQMAFADAYFYVIDDTDPLRDRYELHGHERPTGRRLYEKLLDRLGEPALQAALRDHLADPARRPLRACPALPGPAFFDAWLGPYPRFNLRLAAVHSTRDPRSGRFEHRATVLREGAAGPPEPVTVRFETRDGAALDRVVESASGPTEVSVAAPAALRRVRIDPLQRLVETSPDPSADPRLDNRSDLALRLLVERPYLSFGATDGTVQAAVDLKLRRLYDLRHAFGLRPYHLAQSDGLALLYSYGFGRKVTPNWLLGHLEWSLSASYLRAGAGQAAGIETASGLSLVLDNGLTPFTPLRGYRFVAYAGALLSDAAGQPNFAFQTVVSGSYLWPVTPTHQLAFRGGMGLTFGTVRPQQGYAIGGRGGVRALPTLERSGRHMLTAAVEYRHLLTRALDVSVLRLAWWRALGGALFLDAATVATRGPDLFASADSALAVGYGLRFHADLFGINPSLLAVDLAYPLPITALGRPRPGRLPVGLQIYFTQSF